MGLILLPGSNIGEELKCGYIPRDEVSLTYLGDYSEWCEEQKKGLFQGSIYLLFYYLIKQGKRKGYREGLIIGEMPPTAEV